MQLCQRRLRRLTFGHFSCVLMVLSGMALSGCGLSSGPSEYEQYMKKAQSFGDVIAAAGGNAKKEEKSLHGFKLYGWLIDLSGVEIPDLIITRIIEVAQNDPVFQLNFSNSNITDEQLAKLDAGKVLQKTVDLDLSNTKITDAGLDRLSNMYCISYLNLKGSSATKAGATRLGDRKIASPTTPAPFKKQPEVKI